MHIDIPIMKSIEDTANAFGITPHHARQLALHGLVKAVRVGGRGKILINQQSVCDYFNNTTLTENNEKSQGGIMPIAAKL